MTASQATGRERRREFLSRRVDPRAFAAYLAAVAAMAFTFDHPAVLAVLAFATWAVVVSVIAEDAFRPYLAYGAVASLGVLVINPLVSHGGATPLFAGPALPLVGRLVVTSEALAYGAAMMLRLLAITGVFTLYACLVDADALFRHVAPASPGAAVVLALSVRLFPVMVRDASRIADAQRCRGQRLDSGGWLRRARKALPVLDALVMSSLERAFDTAEALESRGFGAPRRTRLPAAPFAPRDLALLGAALLAVPATVFAALGPARFAFYPRLADPTGGAALATAAVLGMLVLFPAAMAWGWSRWHWLRSML